MSLFWGPLARGDMPEGAPPRFPEKPDPDLPPLTPPLPALGFEGLSRRLPRSSEALDLHFVLSAGWNFLEGLSRRLSRNSEALEARFAPSAGWMLYPVRPAEAGLHPFFRHES